MNKKLKKALQECLKYLGFGGLDKQMIEDIAYDENLSDKEKDDLYKELQKETHSDWRED